jgi:deoxyinosine 3'endonuclease (endonuclease V)
MDSKAVQANNNKQSAAAAPPQPQEGDQQRSPPRSPQRSPRASGIPEAQLKAWEKLQNELAAKASFTDALLAHDVSYLVGDFVAPPAGAAGAAAAASGPSPASAAPAASAPAAAAGLSYAAAAASVNAGRPPLRFVGGLDISFVKDTAVAVASLVVLDVSSLALDKTVVAGAPATNGGKAGAQAGLPVVYEDYYHCTMNVPYVPGYLAFREVDPLRELVKRVKANAPQFVPQVYFVDGNGTMHYRKCGLATHFGVLENVPIVGVAKNLLAVDGLSREAVEKQVAAAAAQKLAPGAVGADGSFSYRGTTLTPMRGDSGFLYGYASLTGNSQTKPVFISPGHGISHRTAALLAVRLALFRVIEPIRQADLRSRQYIQKNLTLDKNASDSD